MSGRPGALADPRYFENGTVEYEITWSSDNTVATLHVLTCGTRHRMRMTIGELDLFREFLNANIEC